MALATLALPCTCACNSWLFCSRKMEGPCSRMFRKVLSCEGTGDVREFVPKEPVNGSCLWRQHFLSTTAARINNRVSSWSSWIL